MSINQTIDRYLNELRNNNYQAVIELFTKDGVVFSPHHEGPKLASDFFSDVEKRLKKSNITIKNIFLTSQQNQNTAAAHILYERVGLDSKSSFFECVDIFEFDNENNKIKQVTIICIPSVKSNN